jgi:copper chaperone CopZ
MCLEVTSMATEETFEVQDMGCPGCENRLKTVLSRAEGVVWASADHRSGQVQVLYDPERVSVDEVRERIRSAGYQVA